MPKWIITGALAVCGRLGTRLRIIDRVGMKMEMDESTNGSGKTGLACTVMRESGFLWQLAGQNSLVPRSASCELKALDS